MSAFGGTPSDRHPADDDLPPLADEPPPRASHRWQWTIGLLVLLLVLILFVPHHSGRSRTLPAGGWGETIGCLERNPLYHVKDSATGLLPTASSRDVVVSRARGTAIAELSETASPSAASAVARHNRLDGIDPIDYHTVGPIVWAYALNGDPPHIEANAGDRTLISFCVRTPTRH